MGELPPCGRKFFLQGVLVLPCGKEVTNRLLREKCATCIYRPGNLMELREGRLKDISDDCNNPFKPSTLACHDTLEYGPNPEFGRAVCRGFYEAYRATNAILQIGDRLGVWEEVDPPQ